MDTTPLPLTDTEFAQLELTVPDDGSGHAVQRRAEALAHIFLARMHAEPKFVRPPRGADIAVSQGGGIITYEIKGTRDTELAWQKLKVSSTHSHGVLIAGTPILRITGVFRQIPIIHTMHHGVDFTLLVEPRWSVHSTDGQA